MTKTKYLRIKKAWAAFQVAQEKTRKAAFKSQKDWYVAMENEKPLWNAWLRETDYGKAK